MKKIIVLLFFCLVINLQSAKTQNYVVAVFADDYLEYNDKAGTW